MSSSDEEEAVLFLALEDEENSRKKKRIWISDINKQRKDFGEFVTLIMSSECFNEILYIIKPDITKMDTNYREAIPPEERLAITLR
ncbi:hypothetical protein ABEB36_012954 [Hypothenemus hampei]|uniref:Uncharacterized protein n=1 Tax=Hypothenemus hampei TaxID=57062 RepID=A0ABD1E6B9_HYPHA